MGIEDTLAIQAAERLSGKGLGTPEVVEEVVEAPVVETPTEEVVVEPVVETPPVAETPPAETPPVETPAPAAETPVEEPAQIDWDTKQKEYEAQIAELKEKAENTPEFEFANERIKKLNELAAGGVDIDSQQFWEMQALDLTKFDTSSVNDGIALRRLELKASNPNLSDAQVERLVQRKYKPLFDDTFDKEDEEYKDAVLDLSIDAQTAQTKLQEIKDKTQLPTVDLSKRRDEELANAKAIETFNLSVKENITGYKEQPFKVGDTELKFIVDDESRKIVESNIVNSDNFFVNNYVKDGKVDFSSLREDMLILANKDKIFKMLKDQGVSEGKLSVVDELESATDETTPTNPTTTVPVLDQALEEIRRRGHR